MSDLKTELDNVVRQMAAAPLAERKPVDKAKPVTTAKPAPLADTFGAVLFKAPEKAQTPFKNDDGTITTKLADVRIQMGKSEYYLSAVIRRTCGTAENGDAYEDLYLAMPNSGKATGYRPIVVTESAQAAEDLKAWRVSVVHLFEKWQAKNGGPAVIATSSDRVRRMLPKPGDKPVTA
jgi:hypothetical protein